jgi:acyl-coenzyme A thioesterase PaaI-like protein
MDMYDTKQVASLTGGVRPGWWQSHEAPPLPDGYLDLIAQTRELLDALSAAVPDADAVSAMTTELRGLTERLRNVAVDEYHQLSGWVSVDPGRGQVLVPPLRIVSMDESRLECAVTFGRYYLGGHGAVHGGAVPLVFDDILGRFAQAWGRPTSRTAYLRVDYRAITPVETPLRLVAEIVSQEGRKTLVRATLCDGEVLCAEAEGLFVVLLPGQP